VRDLSRSATRLSIDAASGSGRIVVELTAESSGYVAPSTVAFELARGLVERHGGIVELHGDRVMVSLPADLGAPVTASRSNRVLLVEDNDAHARALKMGLEALGYTVALAHDGPLALAVARSFQPDVALIDLGLPVMDGYELAVRLRSTHPMPLLAITAQSDRARSEELGFVEHLVKPVDLSQLDLALESIDDKD
jgi:CheY-like chemotaxis protein